VTGRPADAAYGCAEEVIAAQPRPMHRRLLKRHAQRAARLMAACGGMEDRLTFTSRDSAPEPYEHGRPGSWTSKSEALHAQGGKGLDDRL
jgi:hypothetical protein